MQVLCRQDLTDFATWKEVFNTESEARRDAGLTTLQIWRDTDTPTRVVVLHGVNVRDTAETHVCGPQSRHHADRAGITETTCHFLETL